MRRVLEILQEALCVCVTVCAGVRDVGTLDTILHHAGFELLELLPLKRLLAWGDPC